jgi:hypothetical protein
MPEERDVRVSSCIKPVDVGIAAAAVAIWGGASIAGYEGLVGTTSAIGIPIMLWATRRKR